MKRDNLYFELILLVTILISSGNAIADKKTLDATPNPSAKGQKVTQSLPLGLNNDSFKNAPTLINSKSLEVQSEKRIFYYRDNVVVKQADMTMTCDELEGHYNENNQIETLIAKKNVHIVKGENIKADSQRGVYEAATGIFTLTENPHLEQNGSLLSADVVKIFSQENRSVAEGDVQVTVISTKVTPTPAVSPGAPADSSNISKTDQEPTPTPSPIPGVSFYGQ